MSDRYLGRGEGRLILFGMLFRCCFPTVVKVIWSVEPRSLTSVICLAKPENKRSVCKNSQKLHACLHACSKIVSCFTSESNICIVYSNILFGWRSFTNYSIWVRSFMFALGRRRINIENLHMKDTNLVI